MNTILQDQLDRIDAALTTLVDSIATYSPSVAAANTLLSADDEFRTGLKQLVQHQKNHARILALHERISQQNAQITSIVTTLADTRTDLLSTPTSLPQKGARNVPYTELLNYAKRISRYTVPPNFRPPLPALESLPDPTTAVNGNIEDEKVGEATKGMGTEALADEEKKWLEPFMQIPFAPWVSDDVIRRGALAQIQARVEAGEDPAQLENEGVKETSVENEGMKEDMGDTQTEGIRAGDIQNPKEGDRRQERKEAKTEVFEGLDLYDPDNPD